MEVKSKTVVKILSNVDAQLPKLAMGVLNAT